MRSFGIAATLCFAVVAVLFGQAIGDGAVTAAMGADLARTASDGAALAMSQLAANPVQVVTLVLAARMTGEDVFAYLALNVPRRLDTIIAVAGLAVLIIVGDALTLASGRELVPEFSLKVYRSALTDGALLSLWIAVIVVAPVGEEILFRGFLFRGFVHEPRDALPGILAIALIWALLHVEYDWFRVTEVFVIGVYLGYVRLYSGSTTLVIALHMLVNLEDVVESAFALGWV
jgi:uncharacterized protein